ncbi:MAG: 50S ribosomal protein L15 [Solidesulfovibrio sp.]|uniref:50S ribosomal protein L15 n=1 Tax=Solidesulfovibrio sp. TaxID=2910990 RepID=UPI002B20EAB2|nr:50S ribosomal protein L15 [Solidesulfovibrio sp.]MEA4857392.1 50S ribosomal protein L15 [Solidesulfovibrio sp.]
MKLHELYPFPEERQNRKRLGRGRATGQGCTAGKGNKGQNARAGVSERPWFEGGQMPLARRLPKRGFKNFKFKVVYQPLNIERLLAAFEGQASISLDDIYARGLALPGALVKILSQGEISTAITVEAHRFSAKAAEKITNAGGKVVTLGVATEEAETPSE